MPIPELELARVKRALDKFCDRIPMHVRADLTNLSVLKRDTRDPNPPRRAIDAVTNQRRCEQHQSDRDCECSDDPLIEHERGPH